MLVQLKMQNQARNNVLNNWKRFYAADNISMIKQKMTGVAPNTPLEAGIFQLNQQMEDMESIIKNFLPGENPNEASVRQREAIQRFMDILEAKHSGLLKSGTIDSTKHSLTNLLAKHPKLKSFIKKNKIRFTKLNEILNDATIDEETKKEYENDFLGKGNDFVTPMSRALTLLHSPSEEETQLFGELGPEQRLDYINDAFNDEDDSVMDELLDDLRLKVFRASKKYKDIVQVSELPYEYLNVENLLRKGIDDLRTGEEEFTDDNFKRLEAYVREFVKKVDSLIKEETGRTPPNYGESEEDEREDINIVEVVDDDDEGDITRRQSNIPTTRLQQIGEDAFAVVDLEKQTSEAREKLNYLNDFINEYNANQNNSGKDEANIVKDARRWIEYYSIKTPKTGRLSNKEKKEKDNMNDKYKEFTAEVRKIRTKQTKENKKIEKKDEKKGEGKAKRATAKRATSKNKKKGKGPDDKATDDEIERLWESIPFSFDSEHRHTFWDEGNRIIDYPIDKTELKEKPKPKKLDTSKHSEDVTGRIPHVKFDSENFDAEDYHHTKLKKNPLQGMGKKGKGTSTSKSKVKFLPEGITNH